MAKPIRISPGTNEWLEGWARTRRLNADRDLADSGGEDEAYFRGISLIADAQLFEELYDRRENDPVVTRPTVRCGKCARNQFVAEKCRRCGIELPKPDTAPADKAAAPDCRSLFAGMDPLPTLAQMEAALVAEAVSRSGGHFIAAAAAVGTGKTTLYRKWAKLGGVLEYQRKSNAPQGVVDAPELSGMAGAS